MALLTATTPVSKAEVKTEEPDPPSTPDIATLSFDFVAMSENTPKLVAIEVGKSRADEQREREEAEKAAKAAELAAQKAKAAKIAAEKEAERMKHTAAEKSLAVGRSEQKQAEYVRIIGTSREQCVIYAKRITGNPKIRGYAGDLQPDGQEPRVGAGALERNYGHVSVVIAIEGDYLILHDANYSTGHITERRVHKSTQRGYIY